MKLHVNLTNDINLLPVLGELSMTTLALLFAFGRRCFLSRAAAQVDFSIWSNAITIKKEKLGGSVAETCGLCLIN